jgi:hypothetical protein
MLQSIKNKHINVDPLCVCFSGLIKKILSYKIFFIKIINYQLIIFYFFLSETLKYRLIFYYSIKIN